MKRSNIIVLVAALVIAGVSFFVGRHVSRLSDQVADLSGQVEDLGRQAAAAEERAVEAKARAEQAEREAGEAAEHARTAAARELESARLAEAAEAARQVAEQKERQAAAARLEARRAAELAAAVSAAAEERRLAAEQQREEAVREADTARADASRARSEAAAVKKRLQAELDRLESALGRIAATRRTALGLVMTLDSSQIEFDFDKAELRPENREVLARIVGVLLTFDHYGIQVYGHTDDVGTPEYNQELSERRAEAVRDYLVEAGIDPRVLSTAGLGQSSPLVDATDPESRQRNRRVELAIVFSEGEFESVAEPEP